MFGLSSHDSFLLGIGGLWTFSAAVGALQPPVTSSSAFYKWAYAFLKVISGDLGTVFGKYLPPASGSAATKAVLLICLMSLPVLAGCPNSAQLQKAAQASENAAIVVQGLETAETAAYQKGLIPYDDHQFIQKEILTISAIGKTTDSCIGAAGSTAGAVTCVDTAVTQIDQINTQGGLYLKSDQARQDFTLAMTGVKTVLLSVEAVLGGASTPAPAPATSSK